MAEGKKFKMGRWGWAVVTGVVVFLIMWALYGFTNPLSRVIGMMSSNGGTKSNGNTNGNLPKCDSLMQSEGLDANQIAQLKAKGGCV